MKGMERRRGGGRDVDLLLEEIGGLVLAFGHVDVD